MNAIKLLTSDHDDVEALFKKVESTDEAKHEAIFQEIKAGLDAHAHIEETIFYPYMLENGEEKLRAIVKEGIEEHRQIKMFLKEIAALTADAEKFEAKLNVLTEDTRHHVKEEEGEMFPKVKDQFGDEVLEELGAAMEAEKKNFTKAHSAGA